MTTTINTRYEQYNKMMSAGITTCRRTKAHPKLSKSLYTTPQLNKEGLEIYPPAEIVHNCYTVGGVCRPFVILYSPDTISGLNGVSFTIKLYQHLWTVFIPTMGSRDDLSKYNQDELRRILQISFLDHDAPQICTHCGTEFYADETEVCSECTVDYERCLSYMEDGMSRHQAEVMSGLKDPSY